MIGEPARMVLAKTSRLLHILMSRASSQHHQFESCHLLFVEEGQDPTVKEIGCGDRRLAASIPLGRRLLFRISRLLRFCPGSR